MDGLIHTGRSAGRLVPIAVVGRNREAELMCLQVDGYVYVLNPDDLALVPNVASTCQRRRVQFPQHRMTWRARRRPAGQAVGGPPAGGISDLGGSSVWTRRQ
jgi:hypothetical protein